MLNLNDLPSNISIVDGSGKPLTAFQIWWKNFRQQIESSVNDIGNIVENIKQILIDLGFAQQTADGALELAEKAINPDGTIKDEKVLTESVIPNGVTVPGYVESSTPISFASATNTQILAIATTKDLDDSDLEAETQIELFGTDAIDIDMFCEAIKDGVAEVTKDYRLKVDGNNETNMPIGYKFVFKGLDAGDYTIRFSGTRFSSNDCSTSGDYSMNIREYKR